MKKAKPPTRDHHISATLHSWATSLGIHREALTLRLNRANIKFVTGTEIDAKDVFTAMTGDKDAAMTRKLTAEAEREERENRVAAGELLDCAAIEKKLWSEMLQPLRTLLEQQANECAANCNPQNPEVAKAVLTQWLERAKLAIKEPATK
jgi:hypothetical protein